MTALFTAGCNDDGSFSAPERGIIRLTPEQVSEQFSTNFGQRFGYTYNGQFNDILTTSFGPALGGINFQVNGASERDFDTKVQTLLVARSIALTYSICGVYECFEDSQFILEVADIEDRPLYDPWDGGLTGSDLADAKESAGRWEEEVRLMYLRAYGREAGDGEVDMVREHFHTSFESGGYTQIAWITFMYAIFSSAEFWHR